MNDEFDEFWTTHAPGLEAYLRAMSYAFTPDEIHDAVNAAFAWLKGHWSPEDDPEDVMRRLKCVARGRALDMLRRRLKRPRVVRLYLTGLRGMGEHGADVPVLAADEHRRLRIAWEDLSEHDRELLQAHYVEGKPYKVLAAEMGRSETALRQHVSRSLARMRKSIAAVVALLVGAWTRVTRKAVPAAVAAVPVVTHSVLLAIAVTALVVNPLPVVMTTLVNPGATAFVDELDHHPARQADAFTAPVPTLGKDVGRTAARNSGLLGSTVTSSLPTVPTGPKKVDAPCLTKACKAHGDAIVVTIAPGVEKEVSEPYVEMCEYMPVPTKPGDPVYCRDGS